MNTKKPPTVVEAPALVGRALHGRKLTDSEKKERLQCLVHALVESFAALLQATLPAPLAWPITVDVVVQPASGQAPKLDRLELDLVFSDLLDVKVMLVTVGAAERAGRNVVLQAQYDRRPAQPRRNVVRVDSCEETDAQGEWQRGCNQELLLRGFWNLEGLALRGTATMRTMMPPPPGAPRGGAERLGVELRLVASHDCPEDVARVDVRLPPAFDRSRSPSRRLDPSG